MKISDRMHMWLWILAGLLLLGLVVINLRGAQGPALLNKPRFSELHVVAGYDEKNEKMVNCIVRATFSIDCLEPDGRTITQDNVSIPEFDLLKEANQMVVNADNVQTTMGDLAKDVLAVLEHKWKQAHPDPLPRRRALRASTPTNP